MKTRLRIQRKTSSDSTFTPKQLGLQLRRFSVQAPATPQQQEKPDLQTQLENAKHFGHNFANISIFPPGTSAPPPIQAKLTIGKFGGQITKEQLVQAAKSAEPEVQQASLVSASHSQEMPQDVQAKMETAFNTDFSGVKVYQGDAASSIGALAYTQGNDIHFAQGKFQPYSQVGQELLGHELAHIVQQQQGRVKPTAQVQGLPVNNDSRLEQEADEMGRVAAKGQIVGMASLGSQSSNPAALQQKVIQGVFSGTALSLEQVRQDAPHGKLNSLVKKLGTSLQERFDNFIKALKTKSVEKIKILLTDLKKEVKDNTTTSNLIQEHIEFLTDDLSAFEMAQAYQVDREIIQQDKGKKSANEKSQEADIKDIKKSLASAEKKQKIPLLKQEDLKETINKIAEQGNSINQIWENINKMMREGKPQQDIQAALTQQTEEYIQAIVNQAMSLLGLDPNGYAIVVAGSLSRKEMFPASDIDIVILSEDGDSQTGKKIVDVVRTLSTIAGQIALKHRLTGSKPDASAKGGFDIDGILNGVTNPEKAANQGMRSKATGDNMLEDTRLIGASPDSKAAELYQTFQTTKEDIINTEGYSGGSLADRMAEYPSQTNITYPLNVKQVLLRPPTMLSRDLAQYARVKGLIRGVGQSTWERIAELINGNVIPREIGNRLLESLDFVARVRTQLQLEANAEDDTIKQERSPQETKKFQEILQVYEKFHKQVLQQIKKDNNLQSSDDKKLETRKNVAKRNKDDESSDGA